MGINNDINSENDPVEASARLERRLVEADLSRARGGGDLALNNGRMNRAGALFAKDEILAKQREKDKSEQREAFKRAQEALEEHLRELEEELDRLRKALSDLDELEDLIKAGKFDKNNSHHQSLLRSTGVSADDVQAPDALTRTEERRKTFEERRKEVLKEKEYLKEEGAKILQSDVPDHVKSQEMQELLSHGTSVGVQHLWRDKEASGQIRQEASIVYSKAERNIESQKSGETFAQFTGTSFASKVGIGQGIEAKTENIKIQFTKAVELTMSENQEFNVSQSPSYTGPKISG